MIQNGRLGGHFLKMNIPARDIFTHMFNPDKDQLISHYNHPHASISSVAKLYGVSQPTVRKFLIDNNIPRKTHQQASVAANTRGIIMPDYDQLYDLYVSKLLTIDQLEQYFAVGQNTILKWLDYHQIRKPHRVTCIEAKKKQHANKNIAKNVLVDALNNATYVQDVCDQLSISRGHLRQLIQQYDIDHVWKGKSLAQHKMYQYVEQLIPGWIVNDRTAIHPLELDLFHPDLNIAIEYCGVYWHSEITGSKVRSYHRAKYLACQQRGIQLLTIFDTDNQQVVNQMLNARLNQLFPRVFARNTTVVGIGGGTAKQFHNTYHIDGYNGASTHLALVVDDCPVMVASFSKSRYDSKYQWECMRMSSSVNVVGGASKLFKHFIKTNSVNSIVTYSNLRFGQGNVYKYCGMVRQKDSAPNYHYISPRGEIMSRVKFQKHKLGKMLPKFDHSISEWQNMQHNGFDRIWDCGNAKWVWNK